MAILELMQECFLRDKGYAELYTALQASRSPLCVSELCQGARTMTAALLSKGRRALLVTHSDQRAQELCQDLRELGLRAAHFPGSIAFTRPRRKATA